MVRRGDWDSQSHGPRLDTSSESLDSVGTKTAYTLRMLAHMLDYLSALCAEDNQALGALMAEIHRSGRAMKVLAAMAVQALDFAHLSADRLGGDVQKWLDESVMAQDTAETERGQTELGGEGCQRLRRSCLHRVLSDPAST